MSNSAYQAVEIESHRPVGQARHSIQFARSDARKHLSETGLAWQLQGWFCRQADTLIAKGICQRADAEECNPAVEGF